MRSYQHLIIGNSAAALGAIEAIRSVDRVSSIGVISEEFYPVYARPFITRYFTGESGAEDISYRLGDSHNEGKIDTLLGTTVKAIDTGGKCLKLESGQEVRYDRLLIATGARPVLPPVKGIKRMGVFTLNNLDDSKRIADYLPHVQKVVVIGGGLIGLQAAEALVKLGRRVTVVELLGRVLAPVLDEEASSLVEQAFKDKGVSVLTSVAAQEILGQDDNSPPSGVKLGDGRVIPADMVIVAVGVTPRTELAKGGAIEVGRGILVDDHMETSVKGVFAAGDVAEAYDLLTGKRALTMTWPDAYSQGRIAGLNMAGQEARSPGEIATNAAHFFGLHLVSAGIHTPPADEGYLILRYQKPEERLYRKLVLRDGRIVGLIGSGKPVDKSGVIVGLMRARTDVSGFAQRLFRDWGRVVSTGQLGIEGSGARGQG